MNYKENNNNKKKGEYIADGITWRKEERGEGRR